MVELKGMAMSLRLSARPRESEREPRRNLRIAAIGLLAGSAVCITAAPWAVGDSYSMVRLTVSESAAQGLAGGWVTRLGFVMLGVAVAVASHVCSQRWGATGRWMHRAYAAAVVAAAVFSDAPWNGAPYDEAENALHSAAATLTGVAFSLGVLAVGFGRGGRRPGMRIFDWVAVGGSVVVPPAMYVFVAIEGLAQRMMFLVAFLWYGLEVGSGLRRGGRGGPVEGPRATGARPDRPDW
jgi:hypothetical protein